MLRVLFAAFAAAFVFAAPASAAPLTKEQEAQVRTVVRDYLVNHPEVIEEALIVLDKRKAAARRVKIENDPRAFSMGPKNAKVVVVEFFDYHCGYCKASLGWVSKQVRTRKDIRFVFKEFPILGEESLEASMAAIASQKQGKYLAFHQVLMASKGALDSKTIDALAKKAGVDVARMRRDMKDPAILKYIDDTHALAAEAGYDSTPTFTINGEVFKGAQLDALDRAIREASKAKPQKTAAR